MANTIQIKRTATGNSPGSLEQGELAWVNDSTATAANSYLYIGDTTSSKTVTKIGGSGWGLELLNNTALTGVPTTAASPSQNDNSLKLATTAYVDLAVANSEIATVGEIGDVVVTGLADGMFLVRNGTTNKWVAKAAGGHVTMDNNGDFTVTGVQAGAVTLGADTSGTYVAAITGTTDEIDVSSTGTEAKTYQIGLPNNVVIGGTLTVNGGTTEVKSTVVSVIDPVFVVGDSASADSMDRGVEFKHKTGAGAAKTGFFGWDRSANKFTVIPDRTNNSEVMSGTVGDAIFGSIEGTWAGNVISAAKGGTGQNTSSSTGVATVASGTWSIAATLAANRGGFGIDTSSSTGVASVSSGTWSVAANLAVALGGTGKNSVTTKTLLYGNGTGALQELAAPTDAGAFLSHSSGTPAWTTTVDGGSY